RDIIALASSPASTPGSGDGSGNPLFPLLKAAVRCLNAWVRLDDSGASGCGVSPAELEALSPGILSCLLHLLAPPPAAAVVRQSDAEAVAAVRTAVADLLTDLIGSSGKTCTAAAGGEAADAAAVTVVVQQLVPVGRQAAESLGAATSAGSSEATAAGAAAVTVALSGVVAAVRVAVAVAERNPGGVATGPGEAAVELASMVVAAVAASPSRREVTGEACDFFLAINSVPSAERHPALCAPLFGALLPLLAGGVAYPAGFRGWEEEVEEDEEAWAMFREQQAAELLENMYGQCRTALVAQL
ncbi:hypothetical protein Agub_g7243, partial [Astrephomene gubernaculifera]